MPKAIQCTPKEDTVTLACSTERAWMELLQIPQMGNLNWTHLMQQHCYLFSPSGRSNFKFTCQEFSRAFDRALNQKNDPAVLGIYIPRLCNAKLKSKSPLFRWCIYYVTSAAQAHLPIRAYKKFVCHQYIMSTWP